MHKIETFMIESFDLRLLLLLRSLSPFSPSIASFSRIADLSLMYTPNEMEGGGKAEEKGLKIDEKVFLFLPLRHRRLHSKEKREGGREEEKETMSLSFDGGSKKQGLNSTTARQWNSLESITGLEISYTWTKIEWVCRIPSYRKGRWMCTPTDLTNAHTPRPTKRRNP